ncbi:restriction endonuclease [Heliorestis convoluta]|uniref:restriction endonuclease n=1 Tax=Heliorestis convoluta TaxID=356322 RepID=UPI001A9B7B96|nr:restriction endonuclease [Heliorestis convoluta]
MTEEKLLEPEPLELENLGFKFDDKPVYGSLVVYIDRLDFLYKYEKRYDSRTIYFDFEKISLNTENFAYHGAYDRTLIICREGAYCEIYCNHSDFEKIINQLNLFKEYRGIAIAKKNQELIKKNQKLKRISESSLSNAEIKTIVSNYIIEFDITSYPTITNSENASFNLLTDILCKKLPPLNSKNELETVTLQMLQIIYIDVLSDIFNSEYGDFFSEIDDLPHMIEKYINIDTIYHLDDYSLNKLTSYLISRSVLSKGDYACLVQQTKDSVLEMLYRKQVELTEKKLATSKASAIEIITIHDIDLMTGSEFEHYIASLFKKMGYKSQVTNLSGDQGIDIILEKANQKIGVQTKCYSSSVSNSAIQEVVAGLRFYGLSKGIVVTNRGFTKSAIELAKANNIILWDREFLKQKLEEFSL